MTHHLDLSLTREIKEAVKGLPPYRGGPGVDYSQSPVAYAVNTTVVHIPGPAPAAGLQSIISPTTRALLVQRAAGDGVIGSWSGVSGYVDVVADSEELDPVANTARAELMEECALPPELVNRLPLYLGERFNVPGYHGGVLHILPVLAVYSGAELPLITVDPAELSDYAWVQLRHVQQMPGIDAGYLLETLPRVLNITTRV